MNTFLVCKIYPSGGEVACADFLDIENSDFV